LRAPEQVVVCRAGTADGEAFEAHLIEDLPEGGGTTRAGRGGYTFEQFIDWNQQEIVEAIKEHRGSAPDDD
jgi:hypothetical protein